MPPTKKSPKTAAKRSAPAAKKAAKKVAASKVKKAAGKKAAAPKAPKKAAPKKAAAAASKKPAAPKAKASAVTKAKASGVARAKAAAASKSATKAVASKSSKASKAKQARDVLDFSEFPAGSVSRADVTLCLACIFRLFTNQLGLAPRTAYDEIRRYSPTVEELTAREPQRPFFKSSGDKNARCPYCDAARRWHAPVSVYRVEGVKAADSARRALVKNLPAKDGRFQIDEQRKTAKQVFFEWLERLGQELDFADEGVWLRAAARGYLQRREPKTDWATAFEGARAVRRSQRIDEGFERDGARLFLAPALYNDVLLVQYLVSRSQAHGGVTSEGRLTLFEFVRRLRHGGGLDAQGIDGRDHFEVLEQLVERLTGGDAPVKLHFITDRRALLDRAKEVYARAS
ncbi:MAG TPA: hypothetical protein VM936_06320 [Pyrinomonadaceae bacterium]|nr:hypothetical protein [Pyrinomonadaceae bacterium]